MAATGTPTPNLGLRLPVGTDPASVDDINYNSNLLDTVLGAVGNTSVKDQLDGLSDQIATKYNTIITGITYEMCANVVTVYINGVEVNNASSWTELATLPSSIIQSRYSAHFRSMDGTEIQIASNKLNYRGSASTIYGAFTYVRG